MKINLGSLAGLLGGSKAVQRINAVPASDMRAVLDYYNGSAASQGRRIISSEDWRRFEETQRAWLLGKLSGG